MTTCVTCGHANEAGSAFCENCGGALRSQAGGDSSVIPKAGNAQPAGLMKDAPVERNGSKKIVWGVVAAFLAIVASAGAYRYFVPPEASPETFVKVLAEHFSAKSGNIDDLVCLPIDVFDAQESIRIRFPTHSQKERSRLDWIRMLESEGLYAAEPMQGMYATYKQTDVGQKVIRNRRLCYADGVDSIQVKHFQMTGKEIQPLSALVSFSIRFANLAKWAQSDSANYLYSGFFKKSEIDGASVIVLSGRKWIVSKDAKAIQAAFNNVKARQSIDHAAAQERGATFSFLDRLKKMFSRAPSIVGKWAGDAGELEFFEDKTLVLKTHGVPFSGDDSGTWIQLDDGRIKIEFTILGMKAPPSFAELKGDTLHVTMDRNVQFDVRKVN
jgi:hypothetical protein